MPGNASRLTSPRPRAADEEYPLLLTRAIIRSTRALEGHRGIPDPLRRLAHELLPFVQGLMLMAWGTAAWQFSMRVALGTRRTVRPAASRAVLAGVGSPASHPAFARVAAR